MGPGGQPDIRVREETDSTNREVMDLARSGAPEGVVVVADHQTAGRGRRGRMWTAPPGSALLASVLLRPALAPRSAHLVTMAAALAAADACGQVAGVWPLLKWPNDLVVEGDLGAGKLAGLLAESLVVGDELRAVVVGMGLNVASEAAMVPSAASLEGLAGCEVDRAALLAAWLRGLDRWCSALPRPLDRPALLDAYRARCATLDRRVRVEHADGSFEGRAVEVTDTGELVVATAGGERHMSVADVIHLR